MIPDLDAFMNASCVKTSETITHEVTRWLNDVVIGLNLCPFSARPTRENRVRFFVSNAKDDEGLLQDLEREMELLDEKPASEIETTLVIVPEHLQNFFDYNQFLNWVDRLIKRNRWTGVYQLATFHPVYCFAGAELDDAENLTNRSPYPILHIIREASLEKALANYPASQEIPVVNQARVAALSPEEKQRLFPYLFDLTGES